MNIKNFLTENLKTIFYALIIAIFIRSIFFQPFYIPSSSMEPNLLVGDRLFVTKYSYGYSKHSFPFSPPIFKGRIFNSSELEETQDSKNIMIIFKKNDILFDINLLNESVNYVISIYVQRIKCCFNNSI